MLIIGKLLVLGGIFVVMYAMKMQVSLAGSDVVNVHLLSNRQMFIMIGLVAFISGIIIVSMNKARRVDGPKEDKPLLKKSYRQFSENYSKYEKLAVLSCALMLCAFCLPEKKHLLMNTTYYTWITTDDIAILGFFYFYPIACAVFRVKFNFKVIVPMSLLTLVLTVWNLYEKYSTRYTYNDYMSVITISAGPWMAVISAIMYAVSAFMIFKQSMTAE